LAATAALALAPSHPAHADVLPEIVASFNLATFTPQVFWFAMILAPRNPVVKTVMGSWFPILVATGIHFYVDYVGFTQPGALEEAAKFGAVFDPTIAPWDWANGAVTGPLVGFQSMLENPNFVTEEWAHVLAWDLFVGRWMWLDAVERDVPFLWACLLTTNFTGPPGLLQYFAVCLLSGKGLPPAGGPASSSSSSQPTAPLRSRCRRWYRPRSRNPTPARSSCGSGTAAPPPVACAGPHGTSRRRAPRTWSGKIYLSPRRRSPAERMSSRTSSERQARDEACGSRLVVERACDGPHGRRVHVAQVQRRG
jgi:hypothetical protein